MARRLSASSSHGAATTNPAASSGSSSASAAALEEMSYQQHIAGNNGLGIRNVNVDDAESSTSTSTLNAGNKGKGGRRMTVGPSSLRTPSADRGGGRRAHPATDGRHNSMSSAAAAAASASTRTPGGSKSVHLQNTTKGMASYYPDAPASIVKSAVKSSRKSRSKRSASSATTRKSTASRKSIEGGDTTVDYSFDENGDDQGDATANFDEVASVLNSSLFNPNGSTTDTTNNTGTTTAAAANSNNNNASPAGLNMSTSTASSTSTSGDAMNRSILSDTTELTASHFVFAAMSKQKLRDATDTVEANRAAEVSRLALAAGPEQQQQQQQKVQQDQDDEQTTDAHNEDGTGAITLEIAGLIGSIRSDDDNADNNKEEEEEQQPEGPAGIASSNQDKNDEDETGMDWEEKEDNHMYTLEMSEMIKHAAAATVNGTRSSTASFEATATAASPSLQGTPMSTTGEGITSTPTLSGIHIPSPSVAAEERRRSLSLASADAAPQQLRHATPSGGGSLASMQSPGSAAAQSARRLANSLRKTKRADAVERNNSRRASAPIYANTTSSGDNDNRRNSVAILPGGGRTSLGGGLPLAPSAPTAPADETAPPGGIAALLEEAEDAEHTVGTLSQRRKSSASRRTSRVGSFGGRSSVGTLGTMTGLLPPLTPMGASPISTAPPPSTGSFQRAERLAEEIVAMEAEDRDTTVGGANDAENNPGSKKNLSPQVTDSPARNTRSASKRKSIGSSKDKSPGHGALGSLLPPASPESTQATNSSAVASSGMNSDTKRRRSSTGAKDLLPPLSPKILGTNARDVYADSPARSTRSSSSSKRKTAPSPPHVAPVNDGVSRTDEQDDTIMTVSTASSGGSSGAEDLSSDTANTMMLRDIMQDLPVETAGSGKGGGEEGVALTGYTKKSSKRRKSGNGDSNADEVEDDVDDMSTDGERRETADTQDLKGLLAFREELSEEEPAATKLSLATASTEAIMGNKDETPPPASPSGDKPSPVPNRKDDVDEAEVASPPTGTSLAAKAAPRSILNSSRKTRDSIASFGSRRPSGVRRSVAFGSPELAEYNIGSPSASLTPMPSKLAKEKYVVPENQNASKSFEESESSIEMGDDTANLSDLNGILDASKTTELPSDVNDLLAQADADANGESDHSSGFTGSPAPSETVALEGDIVDLLNVQNQYQSGMSTAETPTLSPGDSSLASSRADGDNKEEHTVELEGDVNALLAQNRDEFTMMSIDASRIENETSPEGPESPSLSPANSVEMTDAQSLASIHSRPRPSNSPTEGDNATANSFQSKKLLFDNRLGQSSPSLSVDANNEDQTEELDADLPTLLANAYANASDSPSAEHRPAPTSRFSSTFIPRTNRMSFGSVATAEATQTIELEANMESLIERIGDDSTDTEEEDTVNDANPETVELEGNMSALVAGIVNGSAAGEGGTTSIELDNAVAQGTSGKKKPKRRKSRFSLVPEGRISLSTNGNEVIETFVTGITKDELSLVVDKPPTPQPEPPTPDPEPEPEAVDVTFDDICKASALLNDHPGFVEPGFDVCLNACVISANCKNDKMVNSANEFLSAVCSSVEESIEADAVNGEAENGELIASKADEMRILQRGARSIGPDSDRTIESLQALARSAEEYAFADWRSWETQVAESLKNTVEPVSNDTEEDEKQD